MKLVSACIVASFAATQWPNLAVAQSTTRAKASASETARDFKVSILNLNRHESDEDVGESGESIEVLASPDVLIQGDVTAFAEASANATVGHLGVSVVGGALGASKNRPGTTSIGGIGASSAAASASWTDTVTLTFRSRSALRAVFNVFMDGDLTASATGAAQANVSFVLTNAEGSRLILPDPPVTGIAQEIPSLDFHVLEEIPGAFRVELSGASGPFTIGLSIALNGAADSNLSLNEQDWTDDVASYSGEVSRSLTWGGLEGVFDLFTGEKLDDWTIESDSGFDYSKPFGAPEPSGIALAATALGVMQMRFRRRVDR